MTDHSHHHGQAAPTDGMLDTLFRNASGLGTLGRQLGGGTNFWLGAAIGAAVVALVSSPETRSALASVFRGQGSAPAAETNGDADAAA